MSENALVSIITPTYNHEKYIGDCIESVLKQTYSHWEMIVINDGSNDLTKEIVKKYLEKESRIRLIHQKNKGIFRLAETYNKAFDVSRGKYIAILEGDDIWEPYKLERQVAALEAHPQCVLAWGKAEMVNHNLSYTYRQVPTLLSSKTACYTNAPAGNILNLLLFENCIPALTLFICRNALVQIHGFKQTADLPLVDIPTLLDISQLGEFYYDSVVLGKWRVSCHQTTKMYSVEIMQKRAALSIRYFRNLPEEIRKNLSVTEEALMKHYDSALHIAYARSGRYKLLRRDFYGARQDYLRSVFYRGLKNPMWRLRSLVGYAFSLLKKDVESLAGVLGKQTYKNCDDIQKII